MAAVARCTLVWLCVFGFTGCERVNPGSPSQDVSEDREDSPADENGLEYEKAASIELVVRPPGEPSPECRITVSTHWTLDGIHALLSRVDWSQEGAPLESIQLIRPDIDMVVVDELGGRHSYQFYWEYDSLVDHDSMRLLETDVSRLRTLVVYEMVHAYGTDVETPE